MAVQEYHKDFRTHLRLLSRLANANEAAGGGGVTSFNSRIGAVLPVAGDYDIGVETFNGRIGAVLPVAGDYDSFFLTPTESDAVYLRLDATNGPITNDLQVDGQIFANVNADISPSSGGAGQLRASGAGYAGYLALDGTAMHVGHNSSSRDLVLQTNETDRMAIDGAGTLTTLRTNLNVSESGSAATRLVFGPFAGSADRYVNIESVTNNDNLEFAMAVQDGVNTRRARFFLSDELGTFGLQGSASSGVPNFELYRGNTLFMDADDTFLTTPLRLRIENTGDLSLSSTTHGFQVGLTSGNNIGIDNNEIAARLNGVATQLNLNTDGGAVSVGENTAGALHVRRGGTFSLFGPSNADSLAQSHNGTDFLHTFVGTTDWEITGLTGEVDFNTIPVRVRRGINGSFDLDAGTGADWAAPIWSIGSGFDGSGESGSGWGPASHYGINWARASHSSAVAEVGEGLYVHRNSIFYAGFGHFGSRIDGELNVWKTSGPHITLRDTNSTGNPMTAWIRFEDSAGTRKGFVGFGSTGTQDIRILSDSGAIRLAHAGVDEAISQNSDVNGVTSGMRIRDHAQTFRDAGFNDLREISLSLSNITLNDEHAGAIILRTGTTNVSVIMQSSATFFPVGSMTTVLNRGTSGTLTISDGSENMYFMDGSGTAVNSTGLTLAIGGVCNIWRQGTSDYYVWGVGLS